MPRATPLKGSDRAEMTQFRACRISVTPWNLQASRSFRMTSWRRKCSRLSKRRRRAQIRAQMRPKASPAVRPARRTRRPVKPVSRAIRSREAREAGPMPQPVRRRILPVHRPDRTTAATWSTPRRAPTTAARPISSRDWTAAKAAINRVRTAPMRRNPIVSREKSRRRSAARVPVLPVNSPANRAPAHPAAVHGRPKILNQAKQAPDKQRARRVPAKLRSNQTCPTPPFKPVQERHRPLTLSSRWLCGS